VSDEQKQSLEVMLKDYEIHKTYSTSVSPGIRYNLISMTLATIGIIISGTMIALAGGELTDLVAWMVAGLWIAFVPAFCLTVMYVWLGEEQRMMRMGDYNRKVEERINRLLADDALAWETFKRRNSIKYPEILIMALFFGLSLVSSVAGVILLGVHFHLVVVWVLVGESVAHGAFALYTLFTVKRTILTSEKV